MFSVTVRDHMMVAHSFRGEVFGPAQRLHGATFVVDATFRRAELDADNIVVDIGLAAARAERGAGRAQLPQPRRRARVRRASTPPPSSSPRSIADRLAERVHAGALGERRARPGRASRSRCTSRTSPGRATSGRCERGRGGGRDADGAPPRGARRPARRRGRPGLPSGGNVYDRRVCDGLGRRSAGGSTRTAVAGRLAAARRPPRARRPGAGARRAARRRAGAARRAGGLRRAGDRGAAGAGGCAWPCWCTCRSRDETGLPPSAPPTWTRGSGETLRAAARWWRPARWAGARAHRAARARPGPGPRRRPRRRPGPARARHRRRVPAAVRRLGDPAQGPRPAGARRSPRVRDLPWTCVCVGPLGRDPGYVERAPRR